MQDSLFGRISPSLGETEVRKADGRGVRGKGIGEGDKVRWTGEGGCARALWDTTITFDVQYKSYANFSKLVFLLASGSVRSHLIMDSMKISFNGCTNE